MNETDVKRIIPESYLISTGIDTSTLIRLFKGTWKTAELLVYQQFFKIKVSPTVYEEFLNYQDSDNPKKLSTKKKFLTKILGATVFLPNEINYKKDDETEDSQIFSEYSEMDVDFLLTDDGDFEELQENYNEIQLLNAKNIWWSFGEFKK
ncbi:MAG: hypothetical protein ACTSR3_16635 [Candidatus Helarchaeota archaeon]